LVQLVEKGDATSSIKREKFNVGVHTLPLFSKDATDRNRTSPFAFTGNKFEFRMVASSMSIADANTVLNSIVAYEFNKIADELEKAENFEQAVLDIIIRIINDHQRIIFNGDGYSEEWVEEAKRRGLPNLVSMVDAIPEMISEHSVEVFEAVKVFSRKELESRVEIEYEIYAKALNIEAKTMISMASTKYIPAVIKYTERLATSINKVKEACPQANVSVQMKLLTKASDLLSQANDALDVLKELDKKAGRIKAYDEKAIFFRREVVPAMDNLRAPIDALEVMVDKEIWPVPTYADMLFDM